MTENQVEFLPFHAINEFMRDDFRLAVIRSALGALGSLPESHRLTLNRLTTKLVKIPGFRHSDKAPALVRAIPTVKAFEKSPELVAAILNTWAEAHASLRAQVYEILLGRGWKTFSADMSKPTKLPDLKTPNDWGILPVEADRTKLPGFLAFWPHGETFEALYQAFSEKFPEEQASLDETSLMAVWLALRLPYQIVGQDGNLIAEDKPAASQDEPPQDQ
jgi:hypothetical protein